MTREAFLADPHVKEMRPWVAARFESTAGWTHRYVDLRTGRPWSCESLSDAFRQYRWNRESWHENKTRLDAYRRDLREAVGGDDADRAVNRAADACERILRWGGVWARNGAYLRSRRSSLLDELRHLQALIDGDHTPSPSEMRRDPSAADTACRMNAGFVKICSLLCDHCVIYDGRGARRWGSSSDSSVNTRVAPRFPTLCRSRSEAPRRRRTQDAASSAT